MGAGWRGPLEAFLINVNLCLLGLVCVYFICRHPFCNRPANVANIPHGAESFALQQSQQPDQFRSECCTHPKSKRQQFASHFSCRQWCHWRCRHNRLWFLRYSCLCDTTLCLAALSQALSQQRHVAVRLPFAKRDQSTLRVLCKAVQHSSRFQHQQPALDEVQIILLCIYYNVSFSKINLV